MLSLLTWFEIYLNKKKEYLTTNMLSWLFYVIWASWYLKKKTLMNNTCMLMIRGGGSSYVNETQGNNAYVDHCNSRDQMPLDSRGATSERVWLCGVYNLAQNIYHYRTPIHYDPVLITRSLIFCSGVTNKWNTLSNMAFWHAHNTKTQCFVTFC